MCIRFRNEQKSGEVLKDVTLFGLGDDKRDIVVNSMQVLSWTVDVVQVLFKKIKTQISDSKWSGSEPLKSKIRRTANSKRGARTETV